jgi:hypothetical protein
LQVKLFKKSLDIEKHKDAVALFNMDPETLRKKLRSNQESDVSLVEPLQKLLQSNDVALHLKLNFGTIAGDTSEQQLQTLQSTAGHTGESKHVALVRVLCLV